MSVYVAPEVARRPFEAAAVAAGSFATIFLIGAADGGYFPPAWGWATVGLVWAALLALTLQRSTALSRLEWAWLAAFGALTLWTVVSMAWSSDVTQTALDTQRTLVYVSAALAATLAVRWKQVTYLIAGAFAGVTAVAVWALATRLFPDSFGVFDPIASYRLSEPVGYWNALGITAAIGLALAVCFAGRASSVAGRGLAGAAVPVLATTIYFTFGRGPWIALAVAAATAAAFSPRRLQLAVAAVVTGAPAAAAIVLASRADSLTHVQTSLDRAADEGRELAVALVALAVAAGLGSAAAALVERRVAIPRAVRTAFAAALIVVIGAALAATFARYGSPVTIVRDAVDAFKAPPPKTGGNLERRLFSLSGSGRAELWEVAWERTVQPVYGSGAGTYEQEWHRHRPVAAQAVDAHNLYVETLMELGAVGLALLAAALVVPLLAWWRARRHALFPGLLAAYVAYLVHAAVDWDWEMPVVTLLAIFAGAALLAAARRVDTRPLARDTRVALGSAALAVATAAIIGLVGSSAVAASERAARDRDYEAAVDHANRAATWAPWSSEPLRVRGEAELARGERRTAAAAFRTALEVDPNDWELWFQLAVASSGRERQRALRRAEELSPLEPEIDRFRESTRK